MAVFTNFATLSYNGVTRNSNTVTGEIMEIFKELHRQGNTIVLITHDSDVAKQAERSINILDGRITEVTRYADA